MNDITYSSRGCIQSRMSKIVNSDTCDFCDHPGGEKTAENQVCIPINRRVRAIDYCIHPIIAALNAGGVPTIASCCGHKERLGMIMLEDGPHADYCEKC